jgi:hypothetical protein
VLLFQKRFHAGLVSGAVTVTFRRWDRPHVRVGGRYRCHPIGVLEVDGVEKVTLRSITEADAIASGFLSRVALVTYIRSAREEALGEDDEVFRVELHHGGDGDRVELALETDLSAEDIAAIAKKLARLDASGAWTRKTIALTDRHPGVAASQLAAKIGRDTLAFKVDVRKLKKLGLTQSFEVGYEVSPRGRAFLEAEARGKNAKKKTAQRTKGG